MFFVCFYLYGIEMLSNEKKKRLNIKRDNFSCFYSSCKHVRSSERELVKLLDDRIISFFSETFSASQKLLISS